MLKVQGAAASSQRVTRAVTGPDPQVGRTVPFSGSRASPEGVCDDRESKVGSVGGRTVGGGAAGRVQRSAEPAGDARPTVGSPVSAPASATAGGERWVPSDGLPFPEPAGGVLPAAQHQVQVALDQVTQPASSGVIRGVSMAVVTMNGSWAGVTGTDGDNVPLVPEAMADIASITKTVTAAEIMFLAQAGQIDLDTRPRPASPTPVAPESHCAATALPRQRRPGTHHRIFFRRGARRSCTNMDPPGGPGLCHRTDVQPRPPGDGLLQFQLFIARFAHRAGSPG